MAPDSPTLVSDLWYDDGNTVLQAESSLFRVSLGVLAARSPIFNDIRKLPRSQDQEMYDDCPLIVLPDKAEDLANFLRAVYNSGCVSCQFIPLTTMEVIPADRFFQPQPSKTDFDTLAGILRLSTKYEIPYLRQRALLHLDTIICNTLQDHDARENKRTIPSSRFLVFLIADLAHEMDLPWLLPPVLYFCTADIATGYDYMYKGERKSMNRSQQVACTKALMPLVKWYQKEVLSFLYWTNVDGCKSSAECNGGRLKLLKACSASKVNYSLISFSGLFEQAVQKVVCTTCCIASRDAHLAGREALWEALPALFDLPPWETLRTLREQALVGS